MMLGCRCGGEEQVLLGSGGRVDEQKMRMRSRSLAE